MRIPIMPNSYGNILWIFISILHGNLHHVKMKIQVPTASYVNFPYANPETHCFLHGFLYESIHSYILILKDYYVISYIDSYRFPYNPTWIFIIEFACKDLWKFQFSKIELQLMTQKKFIVKRFHKISTVRTSEFEID